MNTWDCEKPSKMSAKKVVTPPFTMAGPMVTRLVAAFSVLVPVDSKILSFAIIDRSCSTNHATFGLQ